MKRGGDTGGAEEEPIRRDFPIVPSITGLWPTKAIVPPPPFFLLCLRNTANGAIPHSTALGLRRGGLSYLWYMCLILALVIISLKYWIFWLNFYKCPAWINSTPISTLGKIRGRGWARWSIWRQAGSPTSTIHWSPPISFFAGAHVWSALSYQILQRKRSADRAKYPGTHPENEKYSYFKSCGLYEYDVSETLKQKG